jgi:transposase
VSTSEIIAQKDAEIAQRDEQISSLKHELAQLKKLIFGIKSEKFISNSDMDQLSLFQNGDVDLPHTELNKEKIAYTRNKTSKKHQGRNELPDHLPVQEIVIEPEEDTTGMIKIGEEVTETLEYTPASLVKKRTIRPKYAKPDGEGVVIAKLPPRPIDKSIAEASLLSHICVKKFIDHLPFYRQIKIFERDYDYHPSKSTVNDWFIAVCTLLEPLYNVLKQKVLDSGYIQADESPIKVQDSHKSGSTHQGFQWVYFSPEEKLVLFDYHRSRSVQAPKELLKGYQGWVQCDGYKAYDKLQAIYPELMMAGCLVHTRRKYYEARQTDEKRSAYALSMFRKIYDHEDQCKQLSYQERKRYRDQHTKPLLEQLKNWVDNQGIKVLPKSPLGRAMTYTINQWPKLIKVLDDGRLELDNNLIENKIRPLALGRKNYLFAGSHAAAQRIAMMYSFFGTCKANDVNPYLWLKDTLDKMQSTKMSQLESLLPHKN